jgi:phenylpropionate dioxygenase-like ring-hydroxylating dioxygenase large terminal subunit
MSRLNQNWHPVAESREITRKPHKVEICQTELVLFRQADGTLAALSNRCPHRQAQLSCGKVRGDKIHCPYHGWNYDADGNGYTPKNSVKKLHTLSFKVQEYLGIVWVTSKDNEQELDVLDPNGLTLLYKSNRSARRAL